MRLIEFASLALATWRVASMLSEEEGLFGMFSHLRHLVGDRYDEYSNPYVELLGDRWYHRILYEFAEQLTCLWCCAVWVGIIWTALYIITPTITFYVSVPFALSAVAMYLSSRARARKRSNT